MNIKRRIYRLLARCLPVFIIPVISIFSLSCNDGFENAIAIENSGMVAPLLINSITTTPVSDNHWKKIDSIATPRAGTAMALRDNWLYFYGGEDFFGYTNNFWRYDLETGTVEILTGDKKIAYATLTALGSKLYLIGGVKKTGEGDDEYLNEINRYDILTGSWQTITAGGDDFYKRAYHTAACLGNDIFIHGGYGDPPLAATAELMQGNIYRFDTISDEWTRMAEGPIRMNAASAIEGNKIYIFGGYGKDIAADPVLLQSGLWKYDVSADTWSLVSASPLSAREGAGMAILNEALYLYGGKGETSCVNDTWSFSPATGLWTRLSDGPGARAFHSAVSYVDRIIIFGGYSLNQNGTKNFYLELWGYTLP